jgi:hypothetical protein
MTRVWSVIAFVLLLGIAAYLWSVDEAHNARVPSSEYVLERTQQLIDGYWKGNYHVSLDSGAIFDEFLGTARAPDGTTLRLVIRIQDGDVKLIDGLDKDGMAEQVWVQRKFWPYRFPRLMLFVYAIGLCGLIWGVAYPLLGVLKYRKLQSPAMERTMWVLAVFDCPFIALTVYAIVMLIENWPTH